MPQYGAAKQATATERRRRVLSTFHAATAEKLLLPSWQRARATAM